MTLIIKIEEGIELFKITNYIYWLKIESRYNLAMTFLRYQEYYESPSSDFRGKDFTIIDYMDWYSKTYGKGSFTYPNDWAGFNIPSKVLNDIFDGDIKDWNKYDTIMYKAYCNIDDEKYYLIGANKQNNTLNHEIAHGLYATNTIYKESMDELITNIDPEDKRLFYSKLSEMGYTIEVFDDEIQAYLATSSCIQFERAEKYKEEFKNKYEKFYNNAIDF